MLTIDEAIDQVCEKQPFFNTLIRELKPVDSKEVPTLGTDGEHLFYNAEYLNGLKDNEARGVILHEALHCAFVHPWRREERDGIRWNVATDYAINTIVRENGFDLPEGALVDMKYHGMSAEEIYDKLPKNKQKEEQGWCEKGHWSDNKHGKGQANEGKGKGSVFEKLFGGSRPVKGDLSDDERREKWEQIFESEIVQRYGQAPASIQRIIEKSYYIPVINWSELVQNILSEDETDYTFSSPDRRFLESDFFLPGLYSQDKLKDVVFMYDTSGSISRSDLHAYYNETMNLFENFSTLQGWVGVCDAWLHSFSELNPQQAFEEFRFIGGGGTSFEPVFEEISRRELKPKALFYFTDTQGSFPDEEPNFPVFWLVRSYIGDNSEYYTPFGQVVKFLGT